ncbi:PIN domain-containing protein [Haloferula sargassicola]|uniref:Ribonuclease VapC n=1 Tax=Haloferula sargassicola TaxID=490096 RepID=A0ABP9USX2_9BACT
MEANVLIDSNVYIDALREGRDPFKRISERFDLVDLVCCGVVKAEVLRGVVQPKLRDGLLRYIDVMQMVPTTASLWDEAWHLAWQLDRRGRVLPLQDIVIACCARRAGAAVMTNDKHFREIPDLQVIEP